MIYNSSIEYTHISPIRWVEPEYSRLFPRSTGYVRKMGVSDTWRVQFLSDNDLLDTFKLKVYSYNYKTYLTEFSFTKNSIGGGYYWDAFVSSSQILSAIETLNLPFLDGCVYFSLESDSLWAESLPVYVGSSTDTIQISVHNTTNDFGTVFGDFSFSSIFSFRVEGGFIPGYYTPKGEYETFANQSNEFSVVYSNPYGEFTLNLGDPYGLPDDMVEQISRFLACDIILINMKQFVRVGEIQEEINESRGTRTLKVQLTPATNRTMQNILGDAIYIANEEGNILSTEEDKGLIL